MELVERYLQAVSFWLPTPDKQDILAELSDDISAQVAELEESLGRKVTEGEIGVLLKGRGRPMFVANAYQPQRYLIGPSLFPAYSLVLKVLVLCYLVPSFVVSLALALSPGWLARRGFSMMGAMQSTMAHLWTTALDGLVTITVIFIALERTNAVSRMFGSWDPGKLPPLRLPDRLSRVSAIFEGGILVVLLAWWFTKMGPLMLIDQPGIQVELAPLWRAFYWSFSALWVGNAGLAFANILRPYWTPTRAMLRLLFDVASTALLCWLVQTNIVSNIVISTYTAARSIALKNSINLWSERSLPALIICGVLLASIDGFRIVRVSRRGDKSNRHFSNLKSGYSL